jgi:hypothetical protein
MANEAATPGTGSKSARSRSRSRSGGGTASRNVPQDPAFMNEVYQKSFTDFLSSDIGKKMVEETAKNTADQSIVALRKEINPEKPKEIIEKEKQAYITVLENNGLWAEAAYMKDGTLKYDPDFGDRVKHLWHRQIKVRDAVLTGVTLLLLCVVYEAIAANKDWPKLGWFDDNRGNAGTDAGGTEGMSRAEAGAAGGRARGR